MVQDRYHYALEVKRQDRPALAPVRVTMDWAPAVEWARFMALRSNGAGMNFCQDHATVEPEWSTAQGEPYIVGVRVSLAGNGGVQPVNLPLAYFCQTARKVSKSLVEQKLLEPNEEFHYSVIAFRAPTADAPKPRFTLTVEEVAPSFAVKTAALQEFVNRATAIGDAHKADVPVFLPQRVLDFAAELTRAAGANETAGVLIGNVCRDPDAKQIFVEVTDLIPAKHTVSESTQVTFTAETWTSVDSAIRLRRGGEIMVGWFHSHPAKFWCSPNCSPEARRNCPLGKSFFSGDDCTLHRTVFPMAQSVALLATHAEAGLRHALFGWREGMIVQRGFQVLDAAPGLSETVTCEAVVGEPHEKACP